MWECIVSEGFLFDNCLLIADGHFRKTSMIQRQTQLMQIRSKTRHSVQMMWVCADAKWMGYFWICISHLTKCNSKSGDCEFIDYQFLCIFFKLDIRENAMNSLCSISNRGIWINYIYSLSCLCLCWLLEWCKFLKFPNMNWNVPNSRSPAVRALDMKPSFRWFESRQGCAIIHIIRLYQEPLFTVEMNAVAHARLAFIV